MNLAEFNRKIKNLKCKDLFEPQAEYIGGISGKYGCAQGDNEYIVFEMNERNSPVVIHRANNQEAALDWLFQMAELEEPIASNTSEIITHIDAPPIGVREPAIGFSYGYARRHLNPRPTHTHVAVMSQKPYTYNAKFGKKTLKKRSSAIIFSDRETLDLSPYGLLKEKRKSKMGGRRRRSLR